LVAVLGIFFAISFSHHFGGFVLDLVFHAQIYLSRPAAPLSVASAPINYKVSRAEVCFSRAKLCLLKDVYNAMLLCCCFERGFVVFSFLLYLFIYSFCLGFWIEDAS
jgi:hypothetical protein